MYATSFLVLALAVFGASANCGLSTVSTVSPVVGVSNLGSGIGLSQVSLGSGLGLGSGMTTTVSSTPVFESNTLRLPSVVSPASVQETCNCLNTVVRPHVRKEVYTMPSVQRFVQTTSSPVVETVPYVTGNSADLQTVGVSGSGLSTVSSGFGSVVPSVSSVSSGFGSVVPSVSSVSSGFGNVVPSVSTVVPSVSTVVPSVSTVVPSVSSVVPSVSSVVPSVSTVVPSVSSGFGNVVPTVSSVVPSVSTVVPTVSTVVPTVSSVVPTVSSVVPTVSGVNTFSQTGCF